jgi:hypothetical protein
MNARDAAVAAAERGWFVFPVRPDGKQPRAGLSWPDAACGDPRRVAAANWRPGENYGIAAKPSGLVVVDLDCAKPGYVLPPDWQDEPGIADGRDVLATLAERGSRKWPSTFTVATPSGGWHLYFRAAPGRRIGNRPLGPLIDIRGGGDSNGGYVVGPGSAIGGRVYEVIDARDPEPLPGWIADLLDPPRPRPGSAPVPGAAAGMYPRLRGLVQHVLDGVPGDRNHRLFWAACKAREMVSEGLVGPETAERVLVQAAVEAGLRGGEPEARRTVRSGLRTGSGVVA